MAKKIEKLTDEQAAYLPVFREEWRAKGLRTQWASEAAMRQSVADLYVSRGLKAPVVLVFDDPVQCLWARSVLNGQLRDQLRDQLWGQLGGQLRGQLRDQLRVQLWDQLGVQIRDQLVDQLWGQLGDQLVDQLRGQLVDQLRDQLEDQLEDQLWDQLGVQLWDQLGGQLGGQLGVQLRGQKVENQTLWFSGGAEGYWIAFYEFGAYVGAKFGAEQLAALDAWKSYALTCGPLYPYDGMAFVSRRPDFLAFDEQRRLHSESGPAMRFPSGFSVHAWHGTRVPAEWIDDKSFLTAEIALSQENTALRIAAMQIIGWPRMIEQLDARVINRHPEGLLGGELLAVKKAKFNPLERGEMRFLRAECPRNGIICFRVPDDTKTAHEAQAWKAGLPPSIYQLPATRT